MLKIKGILRTSILYFTTAVLVAASPLAIFNSDAYASKYVYDEETGTWSNDKWHYDSESGKYVKAPKPVVTPVPTESPAPESSNAPASSTDKTVDPDTSNNSVDSTTNGSASTTVNNDVAADAKIKQDSISGNADILHNTTAGSASTGNTLTETTVINSVHSTVGGDTSGVAHFTADINGDVTGDITLGPAISNGSVNKKTNLSSDTNVNNNTALTTDVSANSTSGDARVKANTTAGDAASGDADTVANVLNLINTIIAANQSFVGTINIHGNLNGDILISPDFIPQLIASNSSIVSTMAFPLSTNINDDQNIINNVKLNATSGDASVSGNTTAGSATTGTAMTNLTVLNLTGHEVNGQNSVLVFVNVLGTWIGMIVDAPGATAAALGSGMINNQTTIASNTNLNNNAEITNNIDLASRSGDASVTGNTTAGDASTGNATASANIANISRSTFNLSGWFGILFINVFGSWVGSFGVDTAAGTVAPLSGMAVPQSSLGAPNVSFGFRPDTSPQAQLASLASGTAGVGSGGSDQAVEDETNALLASTFKSPAGSTAQLQALASPREDPFSVIMMITGFSVAGAYGAWWGIRRWMGLHGGSSM